MKPIRAGNSARAFKRGRWRLPQGGGGVASVAVLLSGLSSNAQYSTFALVGDHASIALTANGGAPDTLAWGSTPEGSEYGTGANPTDFSAADTGDPNAPARLYYSGTKDGEDFAGSVAIRAALPVNSVAPAVANDDPTGTDLGDTITITAGTWSGAVSVVQNLYADGALLDTGAAANHIITEAEDNQAITGEEVATSSGGVVTVAATGGFTVDDFVAAAMTDNLAISGTAEVGQTLSLTGGTVTGNPTPTVTYSWKRVSDDTELGTGSTLAVTEAMHGEAIYAEKTADNTIGGGATRTSAATAAITYAAPVAGGALADQSFTDDTGNQTFDPTGDFTVAGDGDLSGVTWSLPTTVSGVTINSTTGLITFDTNALAEQTGTAIVVRATNSGGFADSGFSLAITASASAITINSVAVGALSGGELPVTITTVETPDDTSAVYWVLVPTGQSAPSAAQVAAGQNGLGGSPLDGGSFTWTASPPNITLATGIDEFCDLHVVIDNGALSNVGADTNFEVDSTQPGLSAVTGTQTGTTTADWGATSDEAADTIFAAVRLSSDPVLSKANIENGTGDAVATSTDATPTADSANGGSFTGLTAGTAYRVDAFQRDEFGNESAVATSAEFTTASGATFAVTIEQADTVDTHDPTTYSDVAVDWTAAGKIIVPFMTWDNLGPRTISAFDIDGIAASVLTDGVTSTPYDMVGTVGDVGHGVYEADVPDGSGDIDITFSGSVARAAKMALRMTGGQIEDIAVFEVDTTTGAYGGNIDVVSGGALFAFGVSKNFTSGVSISNMAGVPTEVNLGNIEWFYLLETGISTTETRTVEATVSTGGDSRGLILISMGPTP